MNKTIKVLTLATLLIATFNGCTETKTIATTAPTSQPMPVVSNHNVKQFSTINSQETGDIEVVCHNCQAHFKLSQQIQKMSMKGDAIVDCPVCHKDYLGKHK